MPVRLRVGQRVGDLGLARPAVRLAHRSDEGTDRTTDRPVEPERLVGHERDERADDERHARQRERRQLEDERLAGRGRQDREDVAARREVLDRLGLVVAQLRRLGAQERRDPCRPLE